LTLPASSLEKFASKLVVTSIGYVLVSLVLYFIFSVIAFALSRLAFGVAHGIFDPSQPVILLCIGIFLVTQSIFLLGAVYFRRNSFIKTILFLFVSSIVYCAFIALVGALTFYIMLLVTGIEFPFDLFFKGLYYPSIPPAMYDLSGVFVVVIRIVFWFILAPLIWVMAFFRLKDIEV
jgi:hypothetical protein